MQSRGVLVATDANQEWMLPWWWKHYSSHNGLPVLFVDLGMSEEAKQWCKSKGAVCSLPDTPSRVKSKEEMPPTIVQQWESAYGKSFWKSRPSWFKKPLALQQTLFDTTLWLDLDCEVRSDLTPLFSTLTTEIALLPEPHYAHAHMRAFAICQDEETIYNSGVILYRRGSPLIAAWAEACTLDSASHWSDQHLLSRMLHEQKISVDILSPLYNWHRGVGDNLDAHIVHWLGDAGKEYILMNMLST
ncbi:MAG: hypothetical protein V4492_05650 [Chlamydiota bacterium]